MNREWEPAGMTEMMYNEDYKNGNRMSSGSPPTSQGNVGLTSINRQQDHAEI